MLKGDCSSPTSFTFLKIIVVYIRLGEVEKELGEKDQEVAELAVKLERMQQENIMLEEKNKMLVVHIQSSRSDLQEQDSQVRLMILYQSWHTPFSSSCATLGICIL